MLYFSFFISALALAALLFYIGTVALPAAGSNVGFAVDYTAAYLLVHDSREMPLVYDNDWFAAQLSQIAAPGVYDIFNAHPPTMSLMFLPLVGLGPSTARLLWTLLGMPLLLGGLVLLARGLNLPRRWGLWALLACLIYAPVSENFRAGQAYLLLFFLLCGVFWAFLRLNATSGAKQQWRSELVAGLALGLMLTLKIAGTWLALLLLMQRRWRMLVGAAATGAALTLASLPVIGLATWQAYLALLPSLADDPKRYVTAYQTLASLFGHLLVYDTRWNPAPALNAPPLARGLTLAVTMATLALSARWARLSDERHAVRARSLALCAALVVTNMPFAEGYHYTLVLPSLLVAAWWAWHARVGWAIWAVLALAAVLIGAPLDYKSAQLQAGWLALLAYPRVYGAYLLWAWLGWSLARVQDEEGSASRSVIGNNTLSFHRDRCSYIAAS